MHTLKKALLICCVSLVGCMPNPKEREPQKEGVEYNSYTEQIIENHRILREQVRDLRKEAYDLADSVYMARRDSIIVQMDSVMTLYNLTTVNTQKDSVLVTFTNEVYHTYEKILMIDIPEIIWHVDQVEYVDSLKRQINRDDSAAHTSYKRILKQLIEP